MRDDFLPPMHDYVMSHRCPTCKAEPWTDCDAPKKNLEADRLQVIEPSDRQHVRRQDAGSRHYRRDFGKAPWPEDRVPGVDYSTVKYPKEGEA